MVSRLNKSSNSLELIASLQSRIRSVLDSLVPDLSGFALLDFPNHSNVGDSAIWLGEIEYFEQVHGARPVYVSNNRNYVEKECRSAVKNGTIFIHGGGNFGDIWLPHQQFREAIAASFMNNKIVQLPQSIQFYNPENIKKSRHVINNHPDFTLLVRDQKSFDFAKEHYTCKVQLCPDMAFFMGRIPQPVVSETYDAFCLMRTDKEKIDAGSVDMGSALSIKTEDWLYEDPDFNSATRRKTKLLLPFLLGLKAFNKQRRRELLYCRLAAKRVARGARRLTTGKKVITDRLHAHILCILLDIPHIRLDNSYGKVSNFAESWTSQSTICSSAESFEEALEQIGR